MASAQGIVRFGGSPLAKVLYTAYYKNNQGGTPPSGPGAGTRASQWMAGVYLTEASGQYTVSVNSDNFCGAASTVANGDQIVVLFWRNTAVTPAEAAGAFFAGQSRVDGKGGTHLQGFKYDNGAAAQANYGDVDQFFSVVFTMTGQSWTATPGGIGGDVNGDVSLVLNAGPTALISGASTNPLAPTAIQRGVSVAMPNGSQDTLTSRAYSQFSQTLFQQSSAAHNPSGGVQTADGSVVDGSRFIFSDGLTYGRPFGTPAGGDSNTPTESVYAGPLFRDHSHVFTNIDLFRVDLTTKDDNTTGLTATASFYYRASYRPVSATIPAREYCSWTQFLADPSSANVNWNAANPNTINDVVRVRATVTNLDAVSGRINSAARGGIYSKFNATITMDGTGAMVISQPGIDDGLPVSAPFGFITVVSQDGGDIRHSYEITATAAGSITVDTQGSVEVYSARDWYFLSADPAGGTDLLYSWEVNVSATGWQKLGKPAATLAGAVATGTTISIPGIGEGTSPGWSLRFVDGPARGSYRIASVPNDDQVVLVGAGLTVGANAGDTYEIGCTGTDAFWPQGDNTSLDFRVSGTYATGWPSVGTYTYETALGPITNAGSVGNLPPLAALSTATEAGAAMTYNFDGRKSYGTQTTWEQQDVFAAGHTLDGGASFVITDANLDTTNLRDGHAWIAVVNAVDQIQAIYAIVDINRETPDATEITIDTQGATTTYPAGTRFWTTNNYEITGGNQDNDVSSYAWVLRTAAAAQTQPTSGAEFASRFPRLDGSGAGPTWAFTYSGADNGRFACIQLTVTDPEGASNTTWFMFTVSVAAGATVMAARRIEWD